jgi:putative nucleotidyltransferase with HDIG domain
MPSIDQLISGIPKLGSYGGVLDELEAVLGDMQSTLADVCTVIETDSALTARLLKLGNSCFFGFPKRLETVFETVCLIGVQQVRDLTAAAAVIKLFEGIAADHVNMESYWKHCLACGVASRSLAIARQLPKPEKFFVAGLLHDIGRLVLLSRAPDKAREIFSLYGANRRLLWEVETKVLGYDHAEIGAHLLQTWNYPPNLIMAVWHHHTPLETGTYQVEACLVHLADHLVNAMQMGGSGERWVPPVDLKAWDRLRLSTEVLESVVHSIDEQVSAVEQSFLVSPGKPQPEKAHGTVHLS